METTWIEVRRLPSNPENLRHSVTEREWAEAQSMKPVGRRIEWLGWRAIVRERLGTDVGIGYAVSGAPVILGNRFHIGVSHTKGWVAVVCGQKRCAIDIELRGRDTSRTESRFLTAAEKTLNHSGSTDFTLAVWCAKEAVYKYVQREGLDLLDDMTLTGVVRATEPLSLLASESGSGTSVGGMRVIERFTMFVGVMDCEPIEVSVDVCDELVCATIL